MTKPIALLTLASALALAGCGGNGQASMTSFSAAERPESRAELFTLPENQMGRIHIYTVTPAPLTRVLRLTGTVAYNGFLTTPVITQVGGPVSRILVTPGQQVKAGQPLLYVASPDFSQLRAGYIKAKDAFELADKIDKRAQDLYQHGAIAQADVEQADSGRAQALADLEAAEQSLRIVGITKPQDFITQPATGEVALVSPASGEIVERLCNQGQLLQAGTTQCFTLSDMSHVWVLVNIYQNDIADVKVGDEVTITNETYPGAVRGKIQYIAPSLDPATRTLQARIEAANPGERLKKDMYVTAEVQAGTIPDAITIPDAAVLRDAQNMPYVYIETGNRQFARRSITIGDSQGGKTQVLSGLQRGDRIVGDGSLFLQFQNTLQQ
ncbi:MAG TPA: efflux RND transporter periplasmic adaptor subunit [Vicinamibacterales bacterium]|nr:efflux RND transporter periplasmic adaptor subunit [Vicinamibacterales bacterium]